MDGVTEGAPLMNGFMPVGEVEFMMDGAVDGALDGEALVDGEVDGELLVDGSIEG